MKMDWKATTGYCSADYPKLKQGLGDSAKIRAIVSPRKFIRSLFPKRDIGSCRLLAPDRENHVWGYTKRNGADDVLLHSLFIPSQLAGETLVEMPLLLVFRRGMSVSLIVPVDDQKEVRLGWLDE